MGQGWATRSKGGLDLDLELDLDLDLDLLVVLSPSLKVYLIYKS